MTRLFRILAGAVLGLVGLLLGFSLIALNQKSTYEPSLKSQKDLYSDFVKIGRYVETERLRTGTVPNGQDLKRWIEGQEVTSRLLVDNISIVPSTDTCVLGEKTELPDDGHTYRLCYWNNWTEEYAPQTGAHTFTVSIEDFKPPWWLILFFTALAAGLLYGAYRLLRLPTKPEMQLA